MPVGKLAAAGLQRTGNASSRLRDFLELSIGYTLILLVIWTPRPWQQLFYTLAAIFIASLSWRGFHGWGSMGLRVANLGRSLWVVAAAALIAAAIILASSRLGTLHAAGGPLALFKRYWGYALWAFLQQLLLQDFFLRRLLNLVRGRQAAAAWAAASMFAFAHLPNPILTVVTLLWGGIACLLFLRYRNIFPLSIAHAILGITLSVAIPGPVIRNMRVGLGYLTYHAPHRFTHRSTHGSHHRSHADQTVSTHAWVIAEAPTRRS